MSPRVVACGDTAQTLTAARIAQVFGVESETLSTRSGHGVRAFRPLERPEEPAMSVDLAALTRAARSSRTVESAGPTRACFLGSAGMLVVDGGPAAGASADPIVLRLAVPGGDAVIELHGTLHALETPAAPRDRRYLTVLGIAHTARRLDVERCSVQGASGARDELVWAELVPLFEPEVEERMVAHMNDDHVDTMRAYCAHAGIACARRAPAMVGIDQDGFDLHADDGLVRLAFDQPCPTPLAVRQALVALAAQARATGA